MICVKLEGHDWKYQVEDVLRLFFGSEKGEFIDREPPAEYRGIFILNRVEERSGSFLVTTLLWLDGEKISSTDYEIYGTVQEGNDPLREVKREVKRQIYICLSNHLKRELPWGTLTGIRPAKIVHELMQQGHSKEKILFILRDYYKVSPEKADLVYEVAENEKTILERAIGNTVGLYIGIPFCPSRCLYCSFTSNPIGRCIKLVKPYLEALKTEIEGTAQILKSKGYKIQSLYIGGGTPTAIDAESLKTFLTMVEQGFDLRELEEYTLEAGRPDSLDLDKFRVIKNSRVDRISINPQTMNDETLRLIGRDHSAQDIVEAFTLARQTGFNNINMDLIIGLPGETADMFKHTLDEIRKLDPESLTVHSMAVKRASRLNENKESFSFTEAEEAVKMVDMALECARSMEMRPYYLYRQKNMVGNLENIGYCRPGSESVYNVQIMEEKQTIVALGAGAITKVVFPEENRIERAANMKSVEDYIRRIDEMVERKRALLT